jgi:hypothetical protein
MLKLSEPEIMDGSLDYIQHRLNGYLMELKWEQEREWERARLVAFTMAKSMGATKAKTEKDFMKIGEDLKPNTLTDEQIKRLRDL